MGRWIPEECGKIVDDTSAFLGRANGDEEARALCEIHNADCDAYEARIAELEAELDNANAIATWVDGLQTELARVKAKSLRVVEDGEATLDSIDEECVFRDSDGDIGFASGGECWLRPNEIVTKLRLERWETEDGN